MLKSRLGLAALISLASAGAVRADGWIFTVGAQVGVSPPYEGANRDRLEPGPTFDLRPAGAPVRFTPPDGGTTIALLSTKYIEIGPMARFRYERNNSGELAGFDKVRWAAEPGAYMDLWPLPWLRLRAEGRKGVTGHIGWVGDAGADLVYTGKRWDASVGPRFGWGDQRYMDTYFGVTPVEAARSPVVNQAYMPGAGERYGGVETAVAYHINRRLRVVADVGYQRLSRVAADSPIVRLAGSPNQYMSSVGFRYDFGRVP